MRAKKKSPNRGRKGKKKCCAHLSSYLIGRAECDETSPSGMRVAVSRPTFSQLRARPHSFALSTSAVFHYRPSRSAECPVPARRFAKQIASFTYIIFAFFFFACRIARHEIPKCASRPLPSPAPRNASNYVLQMRFNFPIRIGGAFSSGCCFPCWRCPPAPSGGDSFSLGRFVFFFVWESGGCCRRCRSVCRNVDHRRTGGPSVPLFRSAIRAALAAATDATDAATHYPPNAYSQALIRFIIRSFFSPSDTSSIFAFFFSVSSVYIVIPKKCSVHTPPPTQTDVRCT